MSEETVSKGKIMRLTKITTRTGDDGSTGLADGTRLGKDHARIGAMGSLDELNSQLGVLLAEDLQPDMRAVLLMIQNDLFDLGGALALPTEDKFAQNKIAWLDERIAHYNAGLLPLREFVLPGGSRAGALCHVARTVTRRAERDMVMLAQHDAVPQHALPYLTRLSDLLFVLSRCINRAQSVPETLWHRDK
jgi:cob(I)alamin adenosyltransferase